MKILLSTDTSFMNIDWPLRTTIAWNDEDIVAWVVDPEHPITADDLKKLPNLKVIATASTGTNHIDKFECERRGIKVLSLLDNRIALDEIRASSEFTFLLILNALRRLDNAVQYGYWRRDADYLRGHELYRKMVGLVGHGRIGKNIENWCRAFGAGVYWYDPYDQSNLFQPSLDWLFSNMHIMVICCQLTPITTGMINGELLRKMRNGTCLVNTARGEVVKENELYEVAMERADITFCLDVLVGEPEGKHYDSPLLKLENVVVTPHVAGCTYESNTKAAHIAAQLLRDYFKE